jgi:hypothetical protein
MKSKADGDSYDRWISLLAVRKERGAEVDRSAAAPHMFSFSGRTKKILQREQVHLGIHDRISFYLFVQAASQKIRFAEVYDGSSIEVSW